MNNSKLASLLLALAATVAFAGQAAADEGYYLGASAGAAEFRKSCEGLSPCDDKDLGWRAFGGYRLSRAVAIEVGYANLGKATAPGAEAEVKSLDVSAIGAYHFTESFAVFARVGMHRSQTTVRSTTLGTSSDHNSGFTFGGGIRHAFTRALDLRAELQLYDSVGGAATGKDNVAVVSAAIVLNF